MAISKTILTCFAALCLFNAPFLVASSLLDNGKGSIPNEREFIDVSVKYTRSVDNLERPDYQVTLKAFGRPIQLNLRRPVDSIFALGFTYGTSTVSKESLRDVEKDIFVDPKSIAVVNVVYNKRVYSLHGFVNGTTIKQDKDGRHYVERSVATPNQELCVAVNIDDHSDFKIVPTQEFQNRRRNNGVNADAVVEVQVVYDKKMAAVIGSSGQTVMSYSAVMYHVVNTIYSSMVDPFLTVKLAGVNILSDADDLKIVQNTGHIASPMLGAAATWVQSNPVGLGPGDVVALVTHDRFLDKSGQPSGTAGIGYLRATCGSHRVSATADPGAIWDRVFTMAHEIGHNMGADHDFDTTCSSEGYIMDYNRNTARAYEFSLCSKQAIRDRVNTAAGSCLFTDNAGTGIGLGNSDPGDILSFDAQCAEKIRQGEYGEYTGVNPQPNPADACIKLTCKFRKSDGSNLTITFALPSEGSSCNQSGGRCRKGYCV